MGLFVLWERIGHTLRRRPQTVLSWHSPTRARLALCYGFLQGKWPFGLVEAIWASAAVYHWRQRAKHAQRPARRKCPVNVSPTRSAKLCESQAAKKRGPYKPRQPRGDFKLDLPVSLS